MKVQKHSQIEDNFTFRHSLIFLLFRNEKKGRKCGNGRGKEKGQVHIKIGIMIFININMIILIEIVMNNEYI